MMAKTVFIDGEAGTTGLGIRDRLRGKPSITLRSLPDAARKDRAARLEMMASVDLVVLCLPDEAAREAAALVESLGSKAPKLLDASSAHRCASGWIYGFAELAPGQAQAITDAPRVANPGCYATGAIALLRPLTEAGLIPPDYPLVIQGVSGYSGGGKAMIAAHEAEGGPAFETYALSLNHKHVPEIERYARLARRPLFTPSVGHYRQGMLVSVPFCLDALPGRPKAPDIAYTLSEYYAGSPEIQVAALPVSGRIVPDALNGTDLMELFVLENEAADHVVLMARLDNLGKGASGAAVQNIGLMLGAQRHHVPVRASMAW
jgi:N-acetyl-gamma-glutamyl-phosphate reductase